MTRNDRPPLAVLLVLAACAGPPPADQLARYSGGTVTITQLDALLRSLPSAQRQPSGGETLEQWLDTRIRGMVLPGELVRRAQASGVADDPAVRLRAGYLAGQETGRAFLRGQCPEEPVAEELIKARFGERYPSRPRPWIMVRHIYLRAPRTVPVARRVARNKLEQLRGQLREGASFVELARRHSDSETADDGGLIGRISAQAPIEALVRDAAWALEDGALSDLVEVENGFHLLLRESSGVEAPTPFDEAQETLRRQIARERREACGRLVLEALATRRAAEVDRKAIEDDDPAGVVLRLGDEEFTLAALAGLTADGSPLALQPRPGEALRHFVEAALLAEGAFAEDDAWRARYDRTEVAALRKLLVDAQWRAERRRLIEDSGEERLRAYFNANRERFETDLELDIGLILVTRQAPTTGRRPVLEEALELAGRLADGEPFEVAAERASAHASRESGGRLGFLPLPRLRVLLGSRGAKRAAGLAVGAVSAPVEVHAPPRVSYALLKLYARKEPQARTFDDARSEVIERMSQERLQQLDDAVRVRVLDEIGFTIHTRAVAGYLAELETRP